jgi:two-component system response regulator (stage 0 sporulation protein F)
MKKILVAERKESLCFLYQEELSDEGYEVVTVTRPEDLIQALVREDPDLVLMDTGMDEPGAWPLLRGVRQSGYLMPVILCDTYSISTEFPEALVAGRVLKSSNFDELKAKIKKVLKNGEKSVSRDAVLRPAQLREQVMPQIDSSLSRRRREIV